MPNETLPVTIVGQEIFLYTETQYQSPLMKGKVWVLLTFSDGFILPMRDVGKAHAEAWNWVGCKVYRGGRWIVYQDKPELPASAISRTIGKREEYSAFYELPVLPY